MDTQSLHAWLVYTVDVSSSIIILCRFHWPLDKVLIESYAQNWSSSYENKDQNRIRLCCCYVCDDHHCNPCGLRGSFPQELANQSQPRQYVIPHLCRRSGNIASGLIASRPLSACHFEDGFILYGSTKRGHRHVPPFYSTTSKSCRGPTPGLVRGMGHHALTQRLYRCFGKRRSRRRRRHGLSSCSVEAYSS